MLIIDLIMNFTIAAFEDPLKKREEFAVTLRKQKTLEIIKAKRRRVFDCGNEEEKNLGPSKDIYKGSNMINT